MATDILQYLKHLPATYRAICEQAIAIIDKAGMDAVEEMRSDPSLFEKFRKLISAIQEQYPYYVFAQHRIDIRQILPSADAEYDQEGISDQCFAMLNFCQGERLVNLVRNFDPHRTQSNYPFFTYLHSTINQDCKNLQSQQYYQDLQHGITDLYERSTITKSKQIRKHLRELMEAQTDNITSHDCADVAKKMEVSVEQVERIWQTQFQTTAVMELDRQIGEDGDEDNDTHQYDLIENPNAPMPQLDGQCDNQRWKALEKCYLEKLTPNQQQVYSYCVTAKLIKAELNRLVEKYQSLGVEQRINSVPTLFQAVPDIPMQHLRALKDEYASYGIEIIQLGLFDLAMNKQGGPTQHDIAQILNVSTQAISKQFNAAVEAIGETPLNRP